MTEKRGNGNLLVRGDLAKVQPSARCFTNRVLVARRGSDVPYCVVKPLVLFHQFNGELCTVRSTLSHNIFNSTLFSFNIDRERSVDG